MEYDEKVEDEEIELFEGALPQDGEEISESDYEKYVKDEEKKSKKKSKGLENENEVILRAQKDDQTAWEQIFKQYEKFINYMKIKTRNNMYGVVTEEDLESYVYEGLVKAVREFDVTKEVKFITFAMIVVKNHVGRLRYRNSRRYYQDDVLVRAEMMPSYMVSIDSNQDDRSGKGEGRPLAEVIADDSDIYESEHEQAKEFSDKLLGLMKNEVAKDYFISKSKDPNVTFFNIGEKYEMTRSRVDQLVKKEQRRVSGAVECAKLVHGYLEVQKLTLEETADLMRIEERAVSHYLKLYKYLFENGAKVGLEPGAGSQIDKETMYKFAPFVSSRVASAYLEFCGSYGDISLLDFFTKFRKPKESGSIIYSVQAELAKIPKVLSRARDAYALYDGKSVKVEEIARGLGTTFENVSRLINIYDYIFRNKELVPDSSSVQSEVKKIIASKLLDDKMLSLYNKAVARSVYLGEDDDEISREVKSAIRKVNCVYDDMFLMRAYNLGIDLTSDQLERADALPNGDALTKLFDYIYLGGENVSISEGDVSVEESVWKQLSRLFPYNYAVQAYCKMKDENLGVSCFEQRLGISKREAEKLSSRTAVYVEGFMSNIASAMKLAKSGLSAGDIAKEMGTFTPIANFYVEAYRYFFDGDMIPEENLLEQKRILEILNEDENIKKGFEVLYCKEVCGESTNTIINEFPIRTNNVHSRALSQKISLRELLKSLAEIEPEIANGTPKSRMVIPTKFRANDFNAYVNAVRPVLHDIPQEKMIFSPDSLGEALDVVMTHPGFSAYKLRYVENKSLVEIAKILRKSVREIKNLIVAQGVVIYEYKRSIGQGEQYDLEEALKSGRQTVRPKSALSGLDKLDKAKIIEFISSVFPKDQTLLVLKGVVAEGKDLKIVLAENNLSAEEIAGDIERAKEFVEELFKRARRVYEASEGGDRKTLEALNVGESECVFYGAIIRALVRGGYPPKNNPLLTAKALKVLEEGNLVRFENDILSQVLLEKKSYKDISKEKGTTAEYIRGLRLVGERELAKLIQTIDSVHKDIKSGMPRSKIAIKYNKSSEWVDEVKETYDKLYRLDVSDLIVCPSEKSEARVRLEQEKIARRNLALSRFRPLLETKKQEQYFDLIVESVVNGTPLYDLGGGDRKQGAMFIGLKSSIVKAFEKTTNFAEECHKAVSAGLEGVAHFASERRINEAEIYKYDKLYSYFFEDGEFPDCFKKSEVKEVRFDRIESKRARRMMAENASVKKPEAVKEQVREIPKPKEEKPIKIEPAPEPVMELPQKQQTVVVAQEDKPEPEKTKKVEAVIESVVSSVKAEIAQTAEAKSEPKAKPQKAKTKEKKRAEYPRTDETVRLIKLMAPIYKESAKWKTFHNYVYEFFVSGLSTEMIAEKYSYVPASAVVCKSQQTREVLALVDVAIICKKVATARKDIRSEVEIRLGLSSEEVYSYARLYDYLYDGAVMPKDFKVKSFKNVFAEIQSIKNALEDVSVVATENAIEELALVEEAVSVKKVEESPILNPQDVVAPEPLKVEEKTKRKGGRPKGSKNKAKANGDILKGDETQKADNTVEIQTIPEATEESVEIPKKERKSKRKDVSSENFVTFTKDDIISKLSSLYLYDKRMWALRSLIVDKISEEEVARALGLVDASQLKSIVDDAEIELLQLLTKVKMAGRDKKDGYYLNLYNHLAGKVKAPSVNVDEMLRLFDKLDEDLTFVADLDYYRDYLQSGMPLNQYAQARSDVSRSGLYRKLSVVDGMIEERIKKATECYNLTGKESSKRIAERLGISENDIPNLLNFYERICLGKDNLSPVKHERRKIYLKLLEYIDDKNTSLVEHYLSTNFKVSDIARMAGLSISETKQKMLGIIEKIEKINSYILGVKSGETLEKDEEKLIYYNELYSYVYESGEKPNLPLSITGVIEKINSSINTKNMVNTIYGQIVLGKTVPELCKSFGISTATYTRKKSEVMSRVEEIWNFAKRSYYYQVVMGEDSKKTAEKLGVSEEALQRYIDIYRMLNRGGKAVDLSKDFAEWSLEKDRKPYIDELAKLRPYLEKDKFYNMTLLNMLDGKSASEIVARFGNTVPNFHYGKGRALSAVASVLERAKSCYELSQTGLDYSGIASRLEIPEAEVERMDALHKFLYLNGEPVDVSQDFIYALYPSKLTQDENKQKREEKKERERIEREASPKAKREWKIEVDKLAVIDKLAGLFPLNLKVQALKSEMLGGESFEEIFRGYGVDEESIKTIKQETVLWFNNFIETSIKLGKIGGPYKRKGEKAEEYGLDVKVLQFYEKAYGYLFRDKSAPNENNMELQRVLSILEDNPLTSGLYVALYEYNVNKKTTKQIAEEYGIEESSVMTQFYRERNYMQKMLGKVEAVGKEKCSGKSIVEISKEAKQDVGTILLQSDLFDRIYLGIKDARPMQDIKDCFDKLSSILSKDAKPCLQSYLNYGASATKIAKERGISVKQASSLIKDSITEIASLIERSKECSDCVRSGKDLSLYARKNGITKKKAEYFARLYDYLYNGKKMPIDTEAVTDKAVYNALQSLYSGSEIFELLRSGAERGMTLEAIAKEKGVPYSTFIYQTKKIRADIASKRDFAESCYSDVVLDGKDVQSVATSKGVTPRDVMLGLAVFDAIYFGKNLVLATREIDSPKVESKREQKPEATVAKVQKVTQTPSRVSKAIPQQPMTREGYRNMCKLKLKQFMKPKLKYLHTIKFYFEGDDIEDVAKKMGLSVDGALDHILSTCSRFASESRRRGTVNGVPSSYEIYCAVVPFDEELYREPLNAQLRVMGVLPSRSFSKLLRAVEEAIKKSTEEVRNYLADQYGILNDKGVATYDWASMLGGDDPVIKSIYKDIHHEFTSILDRSRNSWTM